MLTYLKTLTYGMMHMIVAIIVAFVLSGSWLVALSIGIIEPIVQTFFYHMHEKLWKKADSTAEQAVLGSYCPLH